MGDGRPWRAAKSIRDEADAAAKQLAVAREEWRMWWDGRGERELRCILMTAWDPIGVGDVAEAWDEYDGYINGVAHCLREGFNDDDEGVCRVVNYLDHVARLHGSRRRSEWERGHLASALVAWHEWSFRRGGRPPKEWIGES